MQKDSNQSHHRSSRKPFCKPLFSWFLEKLTRCNTCWRTIIAVCAVVDLITLIWFNLPVYQCYADEIKKDGTKIVLLFVVFEHGVWYYSISFFILTIATLISSTIKTSMVMYIFRVVDSRLADVLDDRCNISGNSLNSPTNVDYTCLFGFNQIISFIFLPVVYGLCLAFGESKSAGSTCIAVESFGVQTVAIVFVFIWVLLSWRSIQVFSKASRDRRNFKVERVKLYS